MRSLGPERVRRLDVDRETRAILLPRALGLAAIALIVLLIGRRLAPPGRRILLLAAAAPAMLFVVDGFLALQRVRIEPYVLPEVLPPAPWRVAERDAVRAQREGRVDDARAAWEKAIAAGAPPAPALYQTGLALTPPDPAPGAAKELGLLALAEGNSSEARDRLAGYVAAVGPDPDSLSALAVAEANLGASRSALNSIDEARALTGDSWNGVALQARLYAKAGDARRTVEALRALDAGRKIDRESLRSDPAFLGIATDPIWIAFLNETPK
jgi:hypothetical protein